MIEITPTPSADSRTAKEALTWNSLRNATDEHIGHIQKGMEFFCDMMKEAGENHDHTKIERFDEFFEALTSGKDVTKSQWHIDHIDQERHHLARRVPDDVNLVDLMEHIVDCVMSWASRSGGKGEPYDLDLSPEVLKKAHINTIKLLKDNVTIVGGDDILNKEIK